MERQIKNFDILATTPNRKMALEIAEAGLEAINTEKVVMSSVSLRGDILSVQGREFNLANFKRIKVVGFGKASGGAALALQKILGDRIAAGAVIGLKKTEYGRIEGLVGTHPKPSPANVEASRRVYEIIKD